jgi:pimeloyl-ACP methyl ester carboxylesterase
VRRRFVMIALVLLVIAAILGIGAVATAFWSARIERTYPPTGRFVPVAGGRLHVLELGAANPAADRRPVVLIHGASSNLADMRFTLGDRLAAGGRVILVDRPGHGWSDRPEGSASPARQAALIAEALAHIGVGRFVLVGYSFGGTVAAAFARAYPDRLAGLVLIAPVTHPWVGGLAWYNAVLSAPVVGPLFARSLALPLGHLLLAAGAASVFAPQPMPADYLDRAAVALLLRPKEMLANAQDVAGLKAFVTGEAPHYGEIAVPTIIVTGDADGIVSPRIHARAIAAAVPGARLIVLPGIGHMPQYGAPEAVIAAIEQMSAHSPGSGMP